MGHRVSADDLSVCMDKLDADLSWPFTKDKHELCSFLGLAGYYCHFIPSFSTKAASLNAMLGDGVPVCQSPESLQSFEFLKKALTEAPVLALPRDDCP